VCVCVRVRVCVCVFVPPMVSSLIKDEDSCIRIVSKREKSCCNVLASCAAVMLWPSVVKLQMSRCSITTVHSLGGSSLEWLIM